MKLIELKNQCKNSLSPLYNEREIDTIFYLIAEKVFHKNKTILHLALNEEWSEFENKKILFFHYLKELSEGKPVQYVVGETNFYGYDFFVNQYTLIPRPETEELVEWILHDFPNNEKPKKVLDIGTGSGCIAISLKKQKPLWQITGIDISEKALELSKENATALNVDVDFIAFDLLSGNYELLEKFDIIVSNPPYIKESEKKMINNSVIDFEPNSALFVDDEKPLIFYEAIIALAKNNLQPNGKIYVEINQYLAQETKELFEQNFGEVNLKKDISNNYRMIKASNEWK